MYATNFTNFMRNFRTFILNNPLFAWHGKLCCCPRSSTPRHHLPLSAHSDSRSHVTPRGARWRGTPFIRRFGQTGRFNMSRLWRTLAPLERNGGNAKKAGVGTVECYQSLALFGPIHDSCRSSELNSGWSMMVSCRFRCCVSWKRFLLVQFSFHLRTILNAKDPT